MIILFSDGILIDFNINNSIDGLKGYNKLIDTKALGFVA